MLHYILAKYTCVCKFLHACVASYTYVHTSKISTCVFVSTVCVSDVCPMHVDFMLHARHMRGLFKLWVICTLLCIHT